MSLCMPFSHLLNKMLHSLSQETTAMIGEHTRANFDNNSLTQNDPFADGINGGSPFRGGRPFGGYFGCQGYPSMGREIQEPIGRQVNSTDPLLLAPGTFDQRFGELFSFRPVRSENDRPN